MTQPDRASIERFVRGTLGCGCPDEVFDHFAVTRWPPIAGQPPVLQLQVGSRLLIYVVAPQDGAATDGWVEPLVARGRTARDHHGYNRFRLVIASPVSSASIQEIQERFARAVAGDDQAHLHFVGGDQLPAGLEPQAWDFQEVPASLHADAK